MLGVIQIFSQCGSLILKKHMINRNEHCFLFHKEHQIMEYSLYTIESAHDKTYISEYPEQLAHPSSLISLQRPLEPCADSGLSKRAKLFLYTGAFYMLLESHKSELSAPVPAHITYIRGYVVYLCGCVNNIVCIYLF